MTVSTTDRKQSFAGGQATLTFTFKTLPDHPEYIKVVAVSSGTETLLTYSSEYTVALDSEGVGGVVTLTPSYSTAYTYTVYRDTSDKQESDYDDYNQFPANTLEEDLDRLTLVSQELSEQIDRSVALPVSSTGSGLTLPEPVAGKALKWNATADGLENTTVDIEDAITEAANYASTASTQAGLAQASAVAAAASESNALASEQSAATIATSGIAAATISTSAATSATLSAIAAATSATLAGNYASTASTTSIAAATSATLAGNYATSAGTSAIAAATSATLAGNYATSAGTSAIAAATSATTAASFVPSVSGNSLKLLRVKSDETGTEWSVAPSSSGGVAGALSVFYNSTVTSGSMVVTYATTSYPYLHGVHVCDSNGTLIIPDSLVFAATGVTITMTSYLPISGTWGTLVL